VRTPALLCAAIVGLVVPAQAQERSSADSDSLCAQVARTHRIPGASCRSLATEIVTRRTAQFYAPDPRDVQNRGPRASLAGSPAQADAVPGVEPLAVSGASIALAGTDSGSRAVAAIGLNPAVLFVSPGDANAMATASRIADLSLLIPLDDLDRNRDGTVDYVGIRLRLNLTGAPAGRSVREAGRAFLRAVQGEADRVNRVLEALRRSGNLAACANGLLDPKSSTAALTRRCDGPVDLAADPGLYREMREQVARARREADARYLGLDLRADFGDPTLSGVVPPKTTALTAGLGFGRRVLPLRDDGTSAGFRGRAGLRYTTLPAPGPTSFGFDGAVGFELARPLDEDNLLTLSAGLELRYGGDAARETELQTNYTMFRFALSLPVAGGTGLAVGLSVPLDGTVSPALTVNFNWSLLLGRRSSDGRENDPGRQ
jgi:hypothetical protein